MGTTSRASLILTGLVAFLVSDFSSAAGDSCSTKAADAYQECMDNCMEGELALKNETDFNVALNRAMDQLAAGALKPDAFTTYMSGTSAMRSRVAEIDADNFRRECHPDCWQLNKEVLKSCR